MSAVSEVQIRSAALQQQAYKVCPERKIHVLFDRSHQLREQMTHSIRLRLESQGGMLIQRRLELRQEIILLLDNRSTRLAGLRAGLNGISPMGVLDRGYALVYGQNEKLVTSKTAAIREKDLKIRFADGLVEVTRKDRRYDGKGNDV